MVGLVVPQIKEGDGPQNNEATFHEISPGEVNPAVMPKHISFPKVPGNSELLHELILFLFTTCVAMMQFINIYRTHWWLPNSHMTEYVKVSMIDPLVVIVIITMNSRRLIYILSLNILDRLFPSPEFVRLRQQSKMAIEYILIVIWFAGAVIIASQDLEITTYFLLYLFGIYIIIFGVKIEPFLRYSCLLKKGAASLNGMPMHSCSMNPSEICEEVNNLRSDFNNRLKQIIFTSIFGAFYAGYLPCAFASNYVQYNHRLSLLNTGIVCFNIFGMGVTYNFPSKYGDVLHRAALHLGSWTKIIEKSDLGPDNFAGFCKWTNSTLWLTDSIVEYNNHFYRCSAPITAAIPGNGAHRRFYKYFYNPSKLYGILTKSQFAVITVSIISIHYILEWHHIITMAFLNLTNQFVYYKLRRDYLVTKSVYETELNMISS